MLIFFIPFGLSNTLSYKSIQVLSFYFKLLFMGTEFIKFSPWGSMCTLFFLQFFKLLVSLGQCARLYWILWRRLGLKAIESKAFISIPWVRCTGIWQDFMKCLFQKQHTLPCVGGVPKISFLELGSLTLMVVLRLSSDSM